MFFFCSKVEAIEENDTLHIRYDDGDAEHHVPVHRVRKSETLSAVCIDQGSKVEANYRGRGEWFPGEVTRDRGDGTFDIMYDDGDSEICVEERMIRLL